MQTKTGLSCNNIYNQDRVVFFVFFSSESHMITRTSECTYVIVPDAGPLQGPGRT
jgi:hypothetical protein